MESFYRTIPGHFLSEAHEIMNKLGNFQILGWVAFERSAPARKMTVATTHPLSPRVSCRAVIPAQHAAAWIMMQVGTTFSVARATELDGTEEMVQIQGRIRSSQTIHLDFRCIRQLASESSWVVEHRTIRRPRGMAGPAMDLGAELDPQARRARLAKWLPVVEATPGQETAASDEELDAAMAEEKLG